MKLHVPVLLTVLAFATCGCATFSYSENQPVALLTLNPDGSPLARANCTMKNDKGSWEVVSPGFAIVRRSSQDLVVECRKSGLPDGTLRAISRSAGGVFGNLLLGGIPGAIVDLNSGAAYEYPNDLAIRMGASTAVDKMDEIQASAARNGATNGALPPPGEKLRNF